MKYIKKFFESVEEKQKISFEDAKKWIKDNYSEEKVCELFDEEVVSGNWIDREQMEDEGIEDEFEYYTDYGHGEAEDAVRTQILDDLKSKFDLDFDELGDGTDIYDFFKDEYDVLYK